MIWAWTRSPCATPAAPITSLLTRSEFPASSSYKTQSNTIATHHSNMDVYDRLQPEDLKQMAVIVASFVYMAAQRDQMFPRKPIEKELPPLPTAEEEENASPVTNPAAADRPQQPRPAEQRPPQAAPSPTPTPTPRPQ